MTEYNLQSIVQRLLAHLVPDDDDKLATPLPSAAHALSRIAVADTTLPPSATATTSTTLTAAYRLEVAQRIISMCSRDGYENVTDFEWYLSVLVDLAYVSNVGGVGETIRAQLVDVCVRVRAVRPFAVGVMGKLLNDEGMLENCREETGCSEVLWAAAWICGEYCRQVFSLQVVPCA